MNLIYLNRQNTPEERRHNYRSAAYETAGGMVKRDIRPGMINVVHLAGVPQCRGWGPFLAELGFEMKLQTINPNTSRRIETWCLDGK
jgi:hypothetical protein